MFWPEPAIVYVCVLASYDADPRRARPTSFCASNMPMALDAELVI
jgi:hypothetical protein